MAWKLTAARYCFLFLALTFHIEAARPHRNILDLHEESTLAKLRFEAGDPACGRFHGQFLYECFDGHQSSHTPSTQEPAAFVEGAQVLSLSQENSQYRSDCGPLGHHKYRCVPPMETTLKTPDPQDVAAVVQDAQVLPEDASDCGPLGHHKFRCVPPMKTPAKTPVPEDVSIVAGPSVQVVYQPAQSDCGPLSKHKYRCVPPLH